MELITSLNEKILNICKEENFSNECMKKITEILNHNLCGGKLTRLKIFNQLIGILGVKNSNYDVVGYCVELLQSAFIILDDIMDNSDLRRNKDCWYKVVGSRAVKDGYFIIYLIELIIRKCYDENKAESIIGVFDEVVFISCLGQTNDSVDVECKNINDLKKKYNMKNYENICYGKTAMYTYYLPVKLAYICADKVAPDNLKEFCRYCGILFQMQDDYLNYFPEITGKSSKDLEERKVTWFLCKIVGEAKDYDLLNEFFFLDNSAGIMNEIEKLLSEFTYYENDMYDKLRGFVDENNRCVYDLCLSFINIRRK